MCPCFPLCILPFPLPSTNIFIWQLKRFWYLVARGWENFKFLVDLLYWGEPNFVFGREEARLFSLHRAINDESCKLKNSWRQNYMFHVSMLTLFTFTREFSVWVFSVCLSVHWNSQKSVLYCLVITLWKCKYCLIWALNKSILSGSNFRKVSELCDMNSEKKFLL